MSDMTMARTQEIVPNKVQRLRRWRNPNRRLGRQPSLLSLNKNYARRIDTLFRKAYEASEGNTNDSTHRLCRIAVIQEYDGNRSVFLSHADETWPPSREDLLDVCVTPP